MNISTVTKHRLEIQASDLEECIIDSFQDIINDYKREEVEDLINQVKYFHEVLKAIRDKNWRKIFNDGLTMMCLDGDSMEYVENFFVNKRNRAGMELEIVVLYPDGELVTVPERDIQF